MKKGVCLGTHVVALGIGLAAGWVSPGLESPAKSMTSMKSDQAPTSAKGHHSLDVFDELKNEQTDALSRFERLKKSLPVAVDYEGAALAALELLPDFYFFRNEDWSRGKLGWEGVEFFHQLRGEQGERIAEFEVRVLHWMREDSESCVEFLEENLSENLSRHPLSESVFVEYLMEANWNEEVSLMMERYPSSVESALSRKLAEGASFELIENAITSGLSVFNLTNVLGGIAFRDRDRVLDFIIENSENFNTERLLTPFLLSEKHDQEQVLAWVQEVWDSGRIPEEKQGQFLPIIASWLGQAVALDAEERRGFLERVGVSDPQILRTTSQHNVVSDLLSSGRDYCFEFRHGRVSAGKILQDLQAQMPQDFDEVEARKLLFQELVGEDPKRALVLLEGLPEDDKKNVMRRATGRAFTGANPELLLSFTDELPGEWTSQEKENLLRGWGFHSYSNVKRYGKDYLDWMFVLPITDSERAMKKHTAWRLKNTFPHLYKDFEERVAEVKRLRQKKK